MVLPKDLTPEMLVRQPTLLLHMQDFEGRKYSSLFANAWLIDNACSARINRRPGRRDPQRQTSYSDEPQ